MSQTLFLADTHVHIYGEFDLGVLFRAYRKKLNSFRQRHDRTANIESTVGLMCLTERKGQSVFKNLFSQKEIPEVGQITPLPAESSLVIQAKDQSPIFIVAGKQIATKERLEILVLGVEKEFEDGAPFEQSIVSARESGGLVVLPWSPGKWSGKRGDIIEEYLKDAEPEGLAVGDIYLRPRWFAEPDEFEFARSRQIPILAGSDPLPMLGQETRVGSYVSCVTGALNAHKPFASFRDALENAVVGEGDPLLSLGRRANPISTIYSLLRLRVG